MVFFFYSLPVKELVFNKIGSTGRGGSSGNSKAVFVDVGPF